MENTYSRGFFLFRNLRKLNILISNKEKQDRRKKVNGAIALSMLDADAPSEETIKLMNQYVEGEISISKALEGVLDRYY